MHYRFLVWRSATDWPKNIEDGYGPEAPETLPQVVSKALSAHKKSLPGKVRKGIDWLIGIYSTCVLNLSTSP